MVDRGVSVIVASRDAAFRPSIMRGVGSAISADGTQVTVYLRRSQSRQLLQDIEAGGGVAVVFSEPPTHRTLQLKARAATLRPAGPTDQPLLDKYLAAMRHELAQVGYGPGYVAAMLSAPSEPPVLRLALALSLGAAVSLGITRFAYGLLLHPCAPTWAGATPWPVP